MLIKLLPQKGALSLFGPSTSWKVSCALSHLVTLEGLVVQVDVVGNDTFLRRIIRYWKESQRAEAQKQRFVFIYRLRVAITS